MAGINADFSQDGNSVFENVYIYGNLDYQFDTLQTKDLIVERYSYYGGIATFKDDVIIEGRLYLDYLTVNKEFDVGFGGTVFTANTTTEGANVGVGTTDPIQKFQVGVGSQSFVVGYAGTVGIGTTTPFGNWIVDNPRFSQEDQGPLLLEVDGSVHVDRNIYDSVGSPGSNNYWLKRDEHGIRWQPTPPSVDQEGIKIQDEGRFIPIVGAAQTFDTLNFVQNNSFGIGTDTAIPTATPPTWQTIISDREGTIGANSDIIAISTTGITTTGWIIIPNIVNSTSLISTDTTITSIGEGSVVISNSSQLGTPQTVDWYMGEYEYTGIATINTFDLWGYNFSGIGDGDNAPIYRMTKVGINNNSPSAQLDITGTVHATDDVDFDKKLNVDGATTLNDTLDVDLKTDLRANLEVHQNTLLKGTLNVNLDTDLDQKLNVDGDTTLKQKLDVDGDSTFESNVTINADNKLFLIQNDSNEDKFKVDTDNGNTYIYGTLDVDELVQFHKDTDASSSTDGGTLTITGGTAISRKLFVGEETTIESVVDSTSTTTGALKVAGGAGFKLQINVGSGASIAGITTIGITQESVDTDTGALQIKGGASVKKNLNIGQGINVGGAATITEVLELDSHIKDKNDSIGVGAAKTDYRLASVGTGVSWRPSGVQTKNTIWVSMNGMDSNSGLLEGDAKRTIGGAAEIAQTGDTIMVRSGVYYENNPVGLRTEVTVSGEDLRLVTVVPNNVNKDVFQVRAGCLVQNLNFAGSSSFTDHVGCGAVAFPPTSAGVAGGVDFQSVSGYTALGPANQGPDRLDPTKGGRYRSPYVRNCTNFMTGSIGMKINGDYVNAAFEGTNDLGQDLKSMVCDSFTQYNENGIGVSITNNAYAQLVSIFTIGCDIAIFCGSGGQCDLTNSNSSFGNYGLYADGVGDVEFFSTSAASEISGQDSFILDAVMDEAGNFRKPFDGQGAYFHLDMDDYPDSPAAGIVTGPLQFIRSIDIVNGGSGYNEGAPPNVTVQAPQGPEAILPEFSANVSAAGSITSVDVIASGRNFLPDQELTVTFSSGNATATVNTDPILFTVDSATEPTNTGLSTVTFNEFVPYNVGAAVTTEFVRLSRVITSSHSFEYVGAGTDLNIANPFQGGEPIPENEIVSINGGQVPFTSTDQKGNFRIGDGLTIDQTTSTIRGRDFNRAIQAQLTPLILALR